jgi:hypothetical protein
MSTGPRAGNPWRRLLVSAAVGVAMAGTAYLSAWRTTGHATGYRPGHFNAFFELRAMQSALEDYKKREGRYPDKLANLKSLGSDGIDVDGSGEVRDGWDNPYQYHAEESTYALFSFGRDGKPGGEGLDQDFDIRDIRASKEGRALFPAVGVPTLWQFTFECPTGGVKFACAIAGIFAFIACVSNLTKPRQNFALSLIGLGLTLAACLFTAVIMSALHIPTNH